MLSKSRYIFIERTRLLMGSPTWLIPEIRISEVEGTTTLVPC
ncbi:MAG: hypothetical protein Ct9H300mP19_02020 [Dehalococcoidia bacterium]|nr:MAG: hypothetical protein Ct9H300mP19_02020 [Dehalococcoidia bacterium]